MSLTLSSLHAAGLVVLLSAPAWSAVDQEEVDAGPTYLAAQTGHGGLTGGVGPGGEIVLVAWPSPVGRSQVRFRTAALADARNLPRFGAAQDDGVHLGLRVDGELRWLRDDGWVTRVEQGDTETVVTLHEAADLGLAVVEETFVDPDTDVLFRRVSVSREASSWVTDADVVLFENLDLDAGGPRDLLAAWDPEAQAIVHGTPSAGGAGAEVLDLWLTTDWIVEDWAQDGWPSLRDAWDSTPWSGVAAMVGAAVPPDAWTIGGSIGPGCGSRPGWTWQPGESFLAADEGSWPASPIAPCDADGAMSVPVGFGPPGFAESVEVDFFLSFGSTRLIASQRLDEARREGFLAAQLRTEEKVGEDGAGQPTPDGLTTHGGPQDGLIDQFFARSSRTVRQTADPRSGQVATAAATQPFRAEERLADSFWSTLALERMGEQAFVERHDRGLRDWQAVVDVVDPGDPSVLIRPMGSWSAVLPRDGGDPNGSSLEASADALWGIVAHANSQTNAAARRARLAAAWPTLARGADWLAACVPASHPALSGTSSPFLADPWVPLRDQLSGGVAPTGVTVLDAGGSPDWAAFGLCSRADGSLDGLLRVRAGLIAAARAARILCREDEVTAFWTTRAHELGALVWEQHHESLNDLWSGETDRLLWPEAPWTDPRHDTLLSDQADPVVARAEIAAAQAQALRAQADRDLSELHDAVRGLRDGQASLLGRTVGLSRWMEADPDWAVQNKGLLAADLRLLATNVADPGTGHLGEVWVSDGVGGTDPRLGQPHGTAAAKAWLAALAWEDGAWFVQAEGDVDPLCPVGEEPELSRGEIACDGSCSSGGPVNGVGSALGLGIAAWLGLRRRRG